MHDLKGSSFLREQESSVFEDPFLDSRVRGNDKQVDFFKAVSCYSYLNSQKLIFCRPLKSFGLKGLDFLEVMVSN